MVGIKIPVALVACLCILSFSSCSSPDQETNATTIAGNECILMEQSAAKKILSRGSYTLLRDTSREDAYQLLWKGTCIFDFFHSPVKNSKGQLIDLHPDVFQLSDVTIPQPKIAFYGSEMERFATSKIAEKEVLEKLKDLCNVAEKMKSSDDCVSAANQKLQRDFIILHFRQSGVKKSLNIFEANIFP